MEKFYNGLCVVAAVLISVHVICGEENATEKTRVRRQYYVCPPGFKRISHNCYYFSSEMATWQNAYFNCKDRHSEMVTLLTAAEDSKLRRQLNLLRDREEWWIGGIYDWEQMKWKWGESGKKIGYHGFSRMGPEDKEKLKWHCVILDPLLGYKWSARSCVLGKKFICQTRVNRVNQKGLEKLRKKYRVDQNTKLNEIPAPFYMKPARNRRKDGVNSGNELKKYRPNGVNVRDSEYAHSPNATQIRLQRKRQRKERKERKERKQRNRKNRKRIHDLMIAGGSHDLNITVLENYRDRRQRNRRNKSKEHNSAELPPQELREELREKASFEEITHKSMLLDNSINPLLPKVIVEEHDIAIH